MSTENNTGLKVFFLLVFFIISVLMGILFGSTGLLFGETTGFTELLYLRLPRVLAALITGGALAICGAALQSILENPLAEPYLLGVSGGAVLGGTIWIITGAFLADSVSGIRLFSFGGALSSVFLLLYINKSQGRLSPVNMLLTGVIFNGFVSAAVTIFKAFIPAVKLQKVTLWLSGYIPYLVFEDIITETIIVLIISFLLLLEAPKLNIISLGDDVAYTSGINVNNLRKRVFIYTSLLTGIVVSLTGLIGFVGLIVPQMLRFLGLINNRYLMPLSFITGGAFVVISDLISRLISGFCGFEPPISAITAVAGCPLFVILLRDYYREKGGE
ncbi:MAG: iron ABC transporter permease [Deltaproteobacteria bacterium]|nr:iron ABC transporter permease [Deltaproteobacteria bacterium]